MPMLHFFPTFGNEVSDSPFAQELRGLGVQHRLFAHEVIFRYRSRLWLLFFGWPKLAAFATRSAVQSLLLSEPKPTAVVVGSHFEVLAFGALRGLGISRGTKIILLGFIFTQRRSAWANRLRLAYFRAIFKLADTVICHSTVEVERYRQLFRGCRARFVFMPYGLHIFGREAPATSAATAAEPRRRYILSAGRSGRDYRTLFDAVDGLDIELHVVCDREAALADLSPPANVKVLRGCYDDDYVSELRHCEFVVIPLGVSDISAGQMVLVQAMAFAKPTVVTRTPTVEEYVRHGVESMLVAQGDSVELRSTISRLLADPELAARLSAQATRAFDERFSMRAYVRHLVACAG
jgi:glycosyltransferase involved in cell wall biosynthesis